MDEDGVLGGIEDRPVAGFGLQPLDFRRRPHREDAQHRLHLVAVAHRPEPPGRDQSQGPPVAGEKREAGVAVHAERPQHLVVGIGALQVAGYEMEAAAEDLGAGRALELVSGILLELAVVVERQGGQALRPLVADAADEGEIGVQRAHHVPRDRLEHLVAGSRGHPQGDEAQHLLQGLARADVGGNAADGADPAIAVEERELGRQIGADAARHGHLLLELQFMAELGHAQVVGTQHIGHFPGEEVVVGAPQHLIGAHLEQPLEGAVDQAQAAVEVLHVDHRAAVVDYLAQAVLFDADGLEAAGQGLAHRETLRGAGRTA
ncbi:hypothetical protein D9M69_504040 [compost metagenome]